MSKIIKIKERHFRHSLKEFWEYMQILEKALIGDITLACVPATLGSSAAAVNAEIGVNEKFTRDMVILLKDGAGKRHSWFNSEFNVSIGDTSALGTAAIAGELTSVTLEQGRAVVTVEYTGTWAEGDAVTLTITGSTILGYTISNATSIDTLVA